MGYYDSFLWLNSFRTSWLDVSMPHITHLGDGVLLGSFTALVLARKRPEIGIGILISLVLVSITIALLKGQVFPDWERPLTVFKDGPFFYFIGLKALKFNSFPSGHSAAAAVVCTWLAWIATPKVWPQILWAAVGILVCYSRTYIGVHFPADILVGSLIGVGVFILTISVILPPISNRLKRQSPQRERRTIIILVGLMGVLFIGDIIRLYTEFYQG